MKKKRIAVIGSGFSSMSAAAFLSKKGHEVRVFEKNDQPGGRARMFEASGFKFDMGPSWYWMPDVFEAFFNKFGKSASDYYDLKRLDPSYKVFFDNEELHVPASISELTQLFESMEKGSGAKLQKFLKNAAYKYEVGINRLVYKPGLSITEYLDAEVLSGLFKFQLFKSFRKYIRKSFKDERILKLLEFPILFLGAKPDDTPALYSLMNYADLKLGTWYPMGGMHEISKSMESLAMEQGATFQYNNPVNLIEVGNRKAKFVHTAKGVWETDFIVGGADYHHIEQNLLSEESRNYNDSYWAKRTMAPSCLLYFLGVDGEMSNLEHHNLFFDEEFDLHAEEIYKTKEWPSAPLFYVSYTSKTDPSVAPKGKSNLFILIPISTGLTETQELQEKYFNLVMDRLEVRTGNSIRNNIIYRKDYATSNFSNDYNSYKGNAYGLANTLKQTAFLKPSLNNNKIKNVFYTGQLTVPGPGVPPAIISGEVVSREVLKEINKK
ncbi:MAG: phytoene desaturase family protein [Flavobacteriales bacterium]|nr:phytoene desaturase family protein [Flavobacteriales bacterium]